MADRVPGLTVPAAFNSLDQAVYTTGNGYPSASWLLKEMAKNDRYLFAELRRQQAVAFPSADIPRAADYVGTDLGLWPVWSTSYLRQIEWRITANIPSGETVGVTPYDLGQDGRNPYQGRNDAATLTGTGAVVNYDPITVDVWPGDLLVGLVLHCDLTSTTALQGGCGYLTGGTVFANSTAAFVTLPSPPRHVVQLYDSVSSVQLTGWHQIIDVRDSQRDPVGAPWTDDVLVCHPPFGALDVPPGANLSYRVRENTYADLHSITLRELPLSGDLGAQL